MLEQMLKSGVVRFNAPIVIGKITPEYFVENAQSSITFTSGSNSMKSKVSRGGWRWT
jgi:hypothetical protein